MVGPSEQEEVVLEVPIPKMSTSHCVWIDCRGAVLLPNEVCCFRRGFESAKCCRLVGVALRFFLGRDLALADAAAAKWVGEYIDFAILLISS